MWDEGIRMPVPCGISVDLCARGLLHPLYRTERERGWRDADAACTLTEVTTLSSLAPDGYLVDASTTFAS